MPDMNDVKGAGMQDLERFWLLSATH